jgi:hypothetical protein
MGDTPEPGHDPPPGVRPYVDPDARAGAAGDRGHGIGPSSGSTPRPFLLTAGRTRGAVAVALESQVVSTAQGRQELDGLSFEYRDIVGLCSEPLAVAEVAARLRLHVGVAQVLIGDLTHQGLVATFQPTDDVTHDVGTILRVIDGLRQHTR